MSPQLKNQIKLWTRILHANVGIVAAISLALIALSCPFIAHKNDTTVGKMLKDIHYGKFLSPQHRWIWIDGQGLMLLFLVGSGLVIHTRTVRKARNAAAEDPRVPGSSVAILFDGKNQEARSRAQELSSALEEVGVRAFKVSSGSYNTANLTDERWLILLGDDTSIFPPIPQDSRRLDRLEILRILLQPMDGNAPHNNPFLEKLEKMGAKCLANLSCVQGWTHQVTELVLPTLKVKKSRH